MTAPKPVAEPGLSGSGDPGGSGDHRDDTPGMTAERVRGLLEAATPGPWNFATAPHDPASETKEEYVTGALNKWHPDATLWTCWAPDPEGEPQDYIIPALTGDGPTSR